MGIIFDPVKNAANIEKHGFSLNAFGLLDFETAVFGTDDRKDYSEKRERVYALLDGRLCTSVFTRRGATIRVITFRKANARERKLYETQR